LRTRAEVHGDPGAALSALTRVLASLIPADLFVTAVYLTLESGGQVRWAAAGQHPPLRMTTDGLVAPLDLARGGLPLGVDADARYQTVSGELAPGERLVLFTDGIFEARDRRGRQLGVDGVRASLEELGRNSSSPGALLDGLVAKVKEHLEGSDFEDDFTLLAVERLSGGEQGTDILRA
jgi:sigma-B regulation protein RsbU (phosphoserine phosphatase)